MLALPAAAWAALLIVAASANLFCDTDRWRLVRGHVELLDGGCSVAYDESQFPVDDGWDTALYILDDVVYADVTVENVVSNRWDSGLFVLYDPATGARLSFGLLVNDMLDEDWPHATVQVRAGPDSTEFRGELGRNNNVEHLLHPEGLDVLRLEISGHTARAYINGVLVITCSIAHPDLSPAGHAGVFLYVEEGGLFDTTMDGFTILDSQPWPTECAFDASAYEEHTLYEMPVLEFDPVYDEIILSQKHMEIDLATADDDRWVASFTSRHYCWRYPVTAEEHCGAPGATWKVYAGSRLKVTLVNELDSAMGHEDEIDNRQFNVPDMTNLHLHGLHVDPVEDDVLVQIFPGEEHEYIYNFPQHHYPGMHWYHPHQHGNTALQLAQGAYGVLFSEPEPSSAMESELAALYRNLPSTTLVLSAAYLERDCDCDDHEVPYRRRRMTARPRNRRRTQGSPLADVTPFKRVELIGGFLTWSQCDLWCAQPAQLREESGADYSASLNDDLIPGRNASVYTVNGQVLPTAVIPANAWHLLYVLNADHQAAFQLKLPNGCDAYMLGVDGIHYETPYDLSSPPYDGYFIAQAANRFEIALKCPEGGVTHEVYHTLVHPTHGLVEQYMMPEDDITFFYLRTTDGEPLAPECQDGFAADVAFPPKPAYLADTLSLDEAEVVSECKCNFVGLPHDECLLSHQMWAPFDTMIDCTESLLGGDPFPKYAQCGESCPGYDDGSICWGQNFVPLGHFWDDDGNLVPMNRLEPQFYVQMGKTVEMTIEYGPHPYHQHIHPFQMQSDSNHDGYLFRRGEWRDNFVLGWMPLEENKIRFHVLDYGGHIVHHCHFLPHEDRGLIAFFDAVDYDPNEDLEHTCPFYDVFEFAQAQLTPKYHQAVPTPAPTPSPVRPWSRPKPKWSRRPRRGARRHKRKHKKGKGGRGGRHGGGWQRHNRH